MLHPNKLHCNHRVLIHYRYIGANTRFTMLKASAHKELNIFIGCLPVMLITLGVFDAGIIFILSKSLQVKYLLPV